MATNFRRYSATPGPVPERLNIANINVGDELVQADWSYSPAKWRETIWTVTKVLKSRLVISRDVTRNGEVVTISERVLVKNSKSWPYHNGEVLTRVEGQSEWNHDSTYLFTPDEPLLAELREENKAAAAKEQARNNARFAAEKIAKNPRHFTTDDAYEAIAALQVFIDANKED